MELLSLRPSKIENKKKRQEQGQKKIQWAIEGEDFKVLMLLALIRKIYKKTSLIIKSKQQYQSRKFKSIQALALSNTNNSFQIIQPTDHKLQNIKQMQTFYLQLKKKILIHLKKKKREYLKASHLAVTVGIQKFDFHKQLSNISNLTEFSDKLKYKVQMNSRTNLDDSKIQGMPILIKPNKISSQLAQEQQKMSPLINLAKTDKKLPNNGFKIDIPSQNNSLANMNNETSTINNLARQKVNQNKSVIDNRHNEVYTSKEIRNKKQYIISTRRSANKFAQRKRNQIKLFNRMNKTLEKCCQNNELTICIENFAIFTRSLSTLKASLSYNSYLIYEQLQQKQRRVLSQTQLLIERIHDTVSIFKLIVKNNQQISIPLLKIGQYFELFYITRQKQILKDSIKQSIYDFTKIAGLMIEFIKNLSINPNFRLIVYGKAKQLEKLLPILTQIRYLINYLIKELQNYEGNNNKFGKTTREQVKTCDKWRNAFMKKYRSNHLSKRLRY